MSAVMTPTWAGVFATAGLGLLCSIVGLAILWWSLRSQAKRKAAKAYEDRHYADVRAWREHADEQTATLRPVVVIARSPLLDEPVIERAEGRADGRHHYDGDVHAARHNHRPLHAFTGGERSLLARALFTKTQLMFIGVLETAGETPPDTFGPPEPMMRRIVWDPSQPEVWRQESLLEIEAS